MSAATVNPSHLSHLTRITHPIPLREHAFALHCQGLRSPAISQELSVPQRTIRSWIAADLKALAEEQRATRRQQLALAVERQHQLSAAAWHEFEAETAARHALLDALLLVLTTLTGAANAESNDAPAHSSVIHTAPVTLPRLPRLPASTPAPRYLSLILQANKEINRLLGLYTLARLHLLTPDDPETEPAPLTDSNIPAKSATASGSPPRVGEGGVSRISGRIGNRRRWISRGPSACESSLHDTFAIPRFGQPGALPSPHGGGPRRRKRRRRSGAGRARSGGAGGGVSGKIGNHSRAPRRPLPTWCPATVSKAHPAPSSSLTCPVPWLHLAPRLGGRILCATFAVECRERDEDYRMFDFSIPPELEAPRRRVAMSIEGGHA